jgi:DNA-binding beta-propeller fold protein YncE
VPRFEAAAVSRPVAISYHLPMDKPRQPFLTPHRRRDLRTARDARRVYARRRALALFLALVVLAVIGYGVSRLVAGGDSSAGSTSSTSATDANGAPTVTSEGENPDASTTESLPSTTTSTVFSPNLAPQKLTIEASPKAVDFTITLQDGTTMTGATPFTGDVPGGNIRVDFAKQGYNPKFQTVPLIADTSFKVWLDPAGQLLESVVRFKCGKEPKQVAFSPDGKELWVSLLAGNGIQIFDPYSGTKLDEVALGGEAVEVIFTKDGKTVYTSQMTSGMVFEIDAATREVRRQIRTKGEWTKVLELSPDEKTLWASNWLSDNISEIDLATGEVTRLLNSVKTPRGLYCTPDGKRLYVAGFKNGELQRIDLATGESTIVYDADTLRHFVADETRGLLYVDDLILNQVFVVDLATEKTTKLVDTDQRPNTIDLSPDGRVLFISDRGKDYSETNYYVPGPEWGDVLVVDTTTGVILDAIVGGNQCTGLDVSPDGKYLAFSDFLDDTIRVYTIPSYETLVAGGGGRAQERFADIKK